MCTRCASAQAADTKKLLEAGVSTVEAVQRMTKRKLEQIKGISTAKAEKVRESAMKLLCSSRDFQTAKDLQQQRDGKIMHVTTGSPELDRILGGGLESGSITEFYGEFRTGKTQLALTMCVTSFLPRDISGGEGRALYLDTEGSFRPERLAPIAARFQIDLDFCLENVLFQRVRESRVQCIAPPARALPTIPGPPRASRLSPAASTRAARNAVPPSRRRQLRPPRGEAQRRRVPLRRRRAGPLPRPRR